MVVGLQCDWAQKSKTGPKLFWTLRNQKLTSGPENCFLNGSGLGHKAQICKKLQIGPKGDLGPENCFLIGLWTGPTGQNCKELQYRPKRSFGPRRLKKLRTGPEVTRWITWAIIDEAQFNLQVLKKLGKSKTSGPTLFMLCDAIWSHAHAYHM